MQQTTHIGGRCFHAGSGVAQLLPGVFRGHLRGATTSVLPRAAAAASAAGAPCGCSAAAAAEARLGQQQRGAGVLCAAASSRRGSRGAASSRPGGGFGRGRRGGGPGKQQLEPWEAQLPAPYRVYYKPGFKPSRYWGPIQLQRQPGGTGVDVSVSDEISGGQLLLLAHPVAFLDGGLGSAPAVEDLHVALLEAELPLNVQHVLSFLPQRPVGAAAPPPAPAAAAAAADAPQQDGADNDQQQQQEQQQEQPATPEAAAAAPAPPPPPYGGKVPQDLEWLVPSSWDVLGLKQSDVTPLTSRQLMRMLQLSSWSEEFRDPAASQVRHERPNGFIGLWPEWAVLGHSCAPNTSVTVVDKYLLLHATTDMQRGTQLTTNKLGSAIALPLAARQAAHWELFGGPCHCERCTLEQHTLSPEATATLQDVADKAQGEWQDRLQAVLGAPSAGTMTDEEAADALTDLQAEITDALLELDELLEACVPDKEQRLLVGAAAYAAHDLAWQMEELLMEEPDLDKLAACVALQRMFARGTDSHVYSAMLLNEAYTARGQEMAKAAEGMRRRTAASQRRLTEAINKLLASGNMAQYVYAEAVACRYGLIPSEGLLPRLEEGMSLFYAGLSAMSAAQSEGLQEVPEVSHNLVVDGIPVVVVDKVDGGSLARVGDGGSSSNGSSGGGASVAAPAGQPRLSIEVVEGGSLSIPSGAADSGAAAAEDVLEAGAVADMQSEPVA